MAQQYKWPHVTTNSTSREGLQKSFFALTVLEVAIILALDQNRSNVRYLNLLKIAVKLPLSYGYMRITTAVEAVEGF